MICRGGPSAQPFVALSFPAGYSSPQEQIGSAYCRNGIDTWNRYMSDDKNNLRYLIDSYRDWMVGEGIPIVEGIAVDLHGVETAPWPRCGGGVRGAFLQLRGRGDFVGLQVIDIPPGGATDWARHLYDEVFYV